MTDKATCFGCKKIAIIRPELRDTPRRLMKPAIRLEFTTITIKCVYIAKMYEDVTV